MQLKRGRVSQALAAASCSLLGGSLYAADDTSWDLSNLYYSETDRVTVKEQVISYKRQPSDTKSFALKLYHDSISGATPNGAAPGDTYTSPSGQVYLTNPDPTVTPTTEFVDERIAVGAEWTRQEDRLKKRSYGLNASSERDYTSLGASYSTEHDTTDRMRTYVLGASASLDTIAAEGGDPNSPFTRLGHHYVQKR